MKKNVKTTEELPKSPLRHALTPEARENQMIALAENLAEEQLRNGTASSQVICEYLKRGSTKHSLELAKLKEENALLRAKTESLESAQRIEELYSKAIDAMRDYAGFASMNMEVMEDV